MVSTRPKSIVVVGVARNCARTLRKSIRTIEAALSGFDTRQWFIVESDSSDATVDTLRQISAQSPNVEFVSLGDLRHDIPARTERIAHCRNVYLEAIRSRSAWRDAGLVAVADLDGINTLLDKSGVESCFERDDWSVCTANQAGPYYDIYALRHATWCPDDWWQQHDFARALGIAERESIQFACHSRMLEIPATAPWIPVESAFGGFALYRAEALLTSDAVYRGTDPAGVGVCEHVPLHRSLTAAGERIFINPKMINAQYTEHTRELVGRTKAKECLRMLAKIAKIQARRLTRPGR